MHACCGLAPGEKRVSGDRSNPRNPRPSALLEAWRAAPARSVFHHIAAVVTHTRRALASSSHLCTRFTARAVACELLALGTMGLRTDTRVSDSSSLSFGARLRYERERRKISIASIAENTKILGALLEGVERDDVSRWPTGFYRRAFMRAYAID